MVLVPVNSGVRLAKAGALCLHKPETSCVGRGRYECVRAQLRQRQTACRNVLLARVWGGATLASHVCFCWQPSVLLRVDKQQSEQATSWDRGQKRSGAVLRPVGAWPAGRLAGRSGRGTGSSGKVVFSAGCGSLCQAPDARKHENRSEDTMSGRLCSSWGVRHMFH